MFSPWYRWTGRRRPENHVCFNVALYGRGGRFTMTERGESALSLTPERFSVGPSAMHWDGSALTIDVDETATPHLDQVRGRVVVRPTAITSVEAPLTPDGAHVWRPFAPGARIDVDFGRKGWNWSGHGYLDANFGVRALEADFRYWTWARLPLSTGAAAFYDAERRDGGRLAIAARFQPDGSVEEIASPPMARLKRAFWLVKREIRSDADYRPRQFRGLFDSPFYNRSAVQTKIFGEETIGVHEALDLDRFASPLLKPLLALRVPRRPHWRAPK